jgi:hypothetical protein
MTKTAEFSEAKQHQNTRRRIQEDNKNLQERGHFNFMEMFWRLENDLASFMLKYISWSFIRTDYHRLVGLTRLARQ